MAQLSTQPSVVVVGCGIAGISAAQRLIDAGFHHVRILEATARSGGRIKTGRLGNNVADLGASYIHGPSEENPVFCWARDYDLLDPEALIPENQDIVVPESLPYVPNWFSSSGQKLNAEVLTPAFEMFEELWEDISELSSPEEARWSSVGHFIRSEALRKSSVRWEDETTRDLRLCAISTLLKMQCFDDGAHSMDDVDLLAINMFKTIKGLDCTFPRGFDGLVKNLMSDLPGGLVSYNQPVRCIHWNNGESEIKPVIVECEDGDKIPADHVIVTMPLGYQKKHHSTLFSPALPPHKLRSMEKLGYGTCDKIFVEFESPWWDSDCEAIYLLWEDEGDLLDKVYDMSKSWMRKIAVLTVLPPSEGNSHALCGWIAGHEAEYMETLTEEELIQSITELIHTFTGNTDVAVKRIVRSAWFHDPWSCGSYSYPGIGCSAQDWENIGEPLPVEGSHSQPLQVLFAGEATHAEHYSTVHGAVLSGWREADRLISHYYSAARVRDVDPQLHNV